MKIPFFPPLNSSRKNDAGFSRILQKLSMWFFCSRKLPHTVIVGQPSADNELSRAEQRDSNSQRKKKPKNSFQERRNAQRTCIRQCTLPATTSPRWWPIVNGEVENPPRAKSSLCRQFNQRQRQENQAEDNGDWCQVDGGCEHWQATCAPHFAGAIYLLHLLPPLFVHMWWQKTCTLTALASLCSGKVGRERGQQQEKKRHIERKTKSSSPLWSRGFLCVGLGSRGSSCT